MRGNMAGKKRRRSYKFTEKTHSKRGAAALVLALLSLAVFVFVVMESFYSRGSGSMYLGSAGVASMLLSIVALVVAFTSLGDENSYKVFPFAGLLCSFLAVGVWVALYVAGCFLV
jgi:hypothetical protein